MTRPQRLCARLGLRAAVDLAHLRTEYPTLAKRTHLNTCSLGAISTSVRAALGSYMDDWETMGASAWYEKWVGALADLRAKFARVVNASPEEVAWVPSVGQALASLSTAWSYVARHEIVACDLDFPATPASWQVRRDARVRWVPSPDGVGVPARAFEDAIGPATRAVVTGRVYYATGYVQDVKTITRAAHEAGALSVVDDYQGTGQLPFDFRDVGCDAYVTGSLKWLCGGTASCFLVVRKDRIREWDPQITGWWANRHMFEFDVKKRAWPEDATKFEMGEVNMAGVLGASAALDRILEIGPHRIRDATQALVDDLLDRLRDAKLDVRSPREGAARSGIVMVAMPDAKKAVARCLAEGIIVDDRPGRVRVSPYWYNTAEDNQRVVEALAASR